MALNDTDPNGETESAKKPFEGEMDVLSATFHLTHACNLRCTYCYGDHQAKGAMSRETAEQATDFCIAEARRQGAGSLEVAFFGGEPLIKQDLLCHIVDYANRHAEHLPVSFKLSTNGLLLTEQVLKELTQRKVYVAISLDGIPEVQDRQRPGKMGRGTSDDLQPVIRRLLEWNPCANVTSVITPASAGCVDRSVQWLFKRGFAYISTALDHGAEWTEEDLRTLKKAYNRLAKWYVDTTRAGKKFYLSCFDDRIRTRTRPPLKPVEQCSFGYADFTIAPSGRIYPCVQFVKGDNDDEFAIGDVRRAFDAERRQQLYDRAHKEKSECRGCDWQDRCSCWCACVNWQSTGHIDKASPLVCQHERILMPIADRVASRLWRTRNPLFIHKQYNPAFPIFSFIEDVIIKEGVQYEEDATV